MDKEVRACFGVVLQEAMEPDRFVMMAIYGKKIKFMFKCKPTCK